MKVYNINITQFLHEFNELYKWLYDFGNSFEISEAASEFDRLMEMSEDFKKFVCEFGKFRKDFITSDREAAAFIGTLDLFI